MKKISVDVERERAEEEHARFVECGGTTGYAESVAEGELQDHRLGGWFFCSFLGD